MKIADKIPDEGWAFNLHEDTSKLTLAKLLAKTGRRSYREKDDFWLKGKSPLPSGKTIAWNEDHWWSVYESSQTGIGKEIILTIIIKISKNERKQVHHTEKRTRKQDKRKGLRVPKRTKQIASSERLTGDAKGAIQRKKTIRQGVLKRSDMLRVYHRGQTKCAESGGWCDGVEYTSPVF